MSPQGMVSTLFRTPPNPHGEVGRNDHTIKKEKKCISMWLDRDLVDTIDRHKIDRRFPTRKYLIENVLYTYLNHVEIEEGSV